MSGDQIIVLVLLVIAFGVGWVARGDGRRRDGGAGEDEPEPSVRKLLEDALVVLNRAVTASATALAVVASTDLGDPARSVAADVLARAAGALAPAGERLRVELAEDHPLTEEFRDSAAAVGLVESWIAGGADPDGTQAAEALQRAARDALGRYRRTLRAITSLP